MLQRVFARCPDHDNYERKQLADVAAAGHRN